MCGMGAATALQVAGAGLEVAGLGLVAWGIVRARHRYAPGMPGLMDHLRNAGGWVIVRLPRRRKDTRVVVGAGSISFGGGHVRVRGTVGLGSWDNVPIERRVLDLRRMFEAQATEIDQLHRERKTQEIERTAAEQDLRDRITWLQGEQDRAIKEAITGDLRREAWGVAFFVFGLVLGTVGNVMG